VAQKSGNLLRVCRSGAASMRTMGGRRYTSPLSPDVISSGACRRKTDAPYPACRRTERVPDVADLELPSTAADASGVTKHFRLSHSQGDDVKPLRTTSFGVGKTTRELYREARLRHSVNMMYARPNRGVRWSMTLIRFSITSRRMRLHGTALILPPSAAAETATSAARPENHGGLQPRFPGNCQGGDQVMKKLRSRY